MVTPHGISLALAGSNGAAGGVTFSWTAPSEPTVTGVLPDAGPFTGSRQVTVDGSAFTGATAVEFTVPDAQTVVVGTNEPLPAPGSGFAAASFFVVSDDEIVLTTPPGRPGTVDVTVTTPGGTSVTGTADQYTYLPPGHAGSGAGPAGGTITSPDGAFALAVPQGAVPSGQHTW